VKHKALPERTGLHAMASMAAQNKEYSFTAIYY